MDFNFRNVEDLNSKDEKKKRIMNIPRTNKSL
jgi:hypothetical protein